MRATYKKGTNNGFHAVVKCSKKGVFLWGVTSKTEFVFKTHAAEAAREKMKTLHSWGDTSDPAWTYNQGPVFLMF